VDQIRASQKRSGNFATARAVLKLKASLGRGRASSAVGRGSTGRAPRDAASTLSPMFAKLPSTAPQLSAASSSLLDDASAGAPFGKLPPVLLAQGSRKNLDGTLYRPAGEVHHVELTMKV